MPVPAESGMAKPLRLDATDAIPSLDLSKTGLRDDHKHAPERWVSSSFTSHLQRWHFQALVAASAILILTIVTGVLSFARPCFDDHVSLVNKASAYDSIRNRARATVSSVLEVFQVYPPVLTVSPAGVLEITDGSSTSTPAIIDNHRASCQQTLVDHSFAFSYGMPFVGTYTPPACNFNRVTWNLTVVSAGRQFDRLGIVYLGDIEVFRTSTAEPSAKGIRWTYLKDMTSYLSLFKQQQKVIFDLGNLVDKTYTAAFNVTITAAYFTAEDSISPADLVLPVSAQKSSQNAASVFTVPDDTASSNLTLPRNVLRAVFTVSATGQSQEEFWWSNALQSDINTYPSSGTLYGYSPFREVQVFIDGSLAGVAWPFPIIFTGGVVPGLWRPLVGIDAFDLKEDEIDVTPWLPLLCDGKAHNFTIRVSGLNDTGNGVATLSEVTGSSWLLTGKLFLWLDTPGHITTGSNLNSFVPAPRLQVSSSITNVNGTNSTVNYQVNAERSLSYQSIIKTSHGTQNAFWRQSLSFSNVGAISNGGNTQINTQQTTGYDISSSGYGKNFSYPLYGYSALNMIADNFTIKATVNRGKDVQTLGHPVFPTGLESFSPAKAIHSLVPTFQGASLSTTQNGNATYIANRTSSKAYSYGTTEQDMTFAGISTGGGVDGHGFPTLAFTRELFSRHVLTVNGSVVDDDETLLDTGVDHFHGAHTDGVDFALSGVPGHGKEPQLLR